MGDTKPRRRLSAELFGTNEEMEALDYEIYGYATEAGLSKDTNSALTQYGLIHIRLKKERLEDRTTFTIGDSLNHVHGPVVIESDGEVPEPIYRDDILNIGTSRVTEPEMVSMPERDYIRQESGETLLKSRLIEAAVLHYLGKGEISTNPEGMLDYLNASSSYNRDDHLSAAFKYLELQYHGGLDVEDILDINFEPDFIKKIQDKTINLFHRVIEGIRSRGIDINIIVNRSDGIQIVPFFDYITHDLCPELDGIRQKFDIRINEQKSDDSEETALGEP